MAGQPVIAGNAPNPNNELAMLMGGYSPQTALAAQHSQYLAQALAAMREQGQNIRTPVALGANLLAEALMQRKYGQSMQDFTTAAAGDRGRFASDLLGSLKADDAPAAAPSAAAAVAPVPDVSTPPPPPTPQNTVPSLSRQAMDYFTGQGLTAPQAAGIVGNFGAESSLDPTRANAAEGAFGLGQWRGPRLAALHQFAQQNGLDVNDPKTQFAFTMQELRGPEGAAFKRLTSATDPAGAADAFTAYERPAGYTPNGPASNVALIDRREAGAQAAMPPAAGITTGPQTGSAPSPSPSASAVPAPGGPASAPAAASPAAGAQVAPQFIHAPVTQQEIDLAKQWMSDPRTYQRGVELAMDLRQRQATRIPPKVQISDTTGQAVSYDPYGRAPPTAEQIRNFRLNPTASVQGSNIVSYDPRDPTHPTITQTGLPTERKAMMMSDGRGGYVNVPGPMTDSERGAYLGLRNDFYGSDPNKEYEKTANALNAVNDMLAHATKNNGVLDMGVLDNLIQAQTGLSAKQGNVQLLLSHLGVPQEFLGRISNLFGNGPITSEVLQQMRSVLRSYATQQAAGAQHRLDQQNALSKAQGFGDLGITLLPLSPDVRFSFQPAPVPGAAPARPGVSSASEFQ